jgi:predicted enzyme related to lactoylglutathione lyase
VKGETQAVAEASGAAGARRWEHTALAVTNLERAIAFYSQAFGYEVLARVRGMSEQIAHAAGLPSLECDLAQLRSPISGHILELLEFGNVPLGSEEHAPTRPGSAHVSFVVEDLETALAAVKRLGGRALGEVTRFPDGRRVFCRDPSETAIELAELRARPDVTSYLPRINPVGVSGAAIVLAGEVRAGFSSGLPRGFRSPGPAPWVSGSSGVIRGWCRSRRCS